MGQEVNLLRALPQTKRSVKARKDAKNPEVVRISREYGEMYFDGPREYGYGGYKYDGRWVPVAKDIVQYFDLKADDRILDIGAARGFLVKDLMGVCPGLEAFGLDVSEYALKTCEPEVVGRLHLGDAVALPFPDGSFDAAVSINTIHNLKRPQVLAALQEIERVTKDHKSFVQVDSYRNEEDKRLFLDWVLTADTHGYPQEWMEIFDEAGYRGDYFWTFV